MAKRKLVNSALDPNDIAIATHTGRSGGKASANVSRAASVFSATIRVVHTPTDLTVEGAIPEGRYTRKQEQLARRKLEAELLAQLTDKVARKLRVSGR